MPLIQGQVVQGYGWLSMSEFTDLITLSQMTPGPIAVNSATFVGSKIAGIPGALAATFGCILPSCILVTLLAKLYLKYREMAMLQGHPSFPPPGGCGHDWFGRNLDPGHGVLGQRRRNGHPAGPDELESCRDFYHLPCSITERQKESHLCDGTGRCAEGDPVIT